MTPEQMAAELRNAGWIVSAPITQENCRHPMMVGSCGMSCDGSGFSDLMCNACGYRSKMQWGPKSEISENKIVQFKPVK